MSDIVERLRAYNENILTLRTRAESPGVMCREAADEIERLNAENTRLREALAWYGEQARLARLIHSDGDPGRHALANDGGARASEALAEQGEK